MSDCGPPCDELSDRQHAFHLLKLTANIPDWKCYKQSGKKGSNPKRSSCEVEASRLLRNPKVKAALAHHREVEALAYSKTKRRQIERLAALAENASMGRFARVARRKVRVETGGDFPEVVEAEDVVLEPWDDKTDDELRAVGKIKKNADGTVEITLRDPVAAERALADVIGWKAPKKVVTTDTGPYLQEVLTAVAAGDEIAARALAKMEEDTILETWSLWKAGEFSGDEGA